jgi:hypothetical protein
MNLSQFQPLPIPTTSPGSSGISLPYPLPRAPVTRDYSTKILYVFVSAFLATCPADHILLEFAIIPSDLYVFWSSSFCKNVNASECHLTQKNPKVTWQYWSWQEDKPLDSILRQGHPRSRVHKRIFIRLALILYSSVQGLCNGLDDRGSIPYRDFLSLHHRVQTGSGAHPASYPMGTWGSFEAGAWSYTSTPLYVFMAWCFIKYKIYLHGTVLG